MIYYPKAICPQRIIQEAIDLLETQINFNEISDEVAERIDNNLRELQSLKSKLPHKI